MKEQWIMEAEQTAKDLAKILAKILYKQITDEADVIGVDKKWYFENVVHYMTTESEEKQEQTRDEKWQDSREDNGMEDIEQ